MNHILEEQKDKIMVFFAAVFTLLTPVHGMVGLILLFVMLDTFTAIYVAVKKSGWDAFQSHKLFNIVPKIFLYCTTIALAWVIDINILENGIMDIERVASKTITMVWIYIEVKSIDENSQRLGNKSIWAIIKEMLFKVKDLKKDINDIKND